MKSLLNEAERYLIDKWTDARLLEESMKEVQTKYQAVGQRVVDSVADAHPHLDFSIVFLNKKKPDGGGIGLGRRAWPTHNDKWPSGLYIQNLHLDLLTTVEEESPTAYIWVAKSAKVVSALACSDLKTFAQRELSPDDFRQLRFEERGESSIYFPAPSRNELLSGLLEADGQRFVDLIVNQFDGMARFIPALDKLLLKAT